MTIPTIPTEAHVRRHAAEYSRELESHRKTMIATYEQFEEAAAKDGSMRASERAMTGAKLLTTIDALGAAIAALGGPYD